MLLARTFFYLLFVHLTLDRPHSIVMHNIAVKSNWIWSALFHAFHYLCFFSIEMAKQTAETFHTTHSSLLRPKKNTKLAENKKTVENHIPNTSRHNNMIITVIIFLTNLLKISYTIILSIIRQIKYLIRISVTNSNHLKMIDGPTGLVNYFKHYTTNFGRTKVWPKWIFVNGNHVTEIRSMFYLKRRLTMEAKKFWHRKMKNYVSIEKFSIQKKKRLFSAARVLWAIHIWFSVATIIRHARD